MIKHTSGGQFPARTKDCQSNDILLSIFIETDAISIQIGLTVPAGETAKKDNQKSCYYYFVKEKKKHEATKHPFRISVPSCILKPPNAGGGRDGLSGS